MLSQAMSLTSHACYLRPERLLLYYTRGRSQRDASVVQIQQYFVGVRLKGLPSVLRGMALCQLCAYGAWGGLLFIYGFIYA